MRFNTHDRTPRTQTPRRLKALWVCCFGGMGLFFGFIAVVCSVSVGSILPAVIILMPMLLLAGWVWIIHKDMERASVEVVGETVTVTDYCFGRKKERVFPLETLASAEILPPGSLRIRGYRQNFACNYLVFYDAGGRYLFKLLCVPETVHFFGAYIQNSR